MFRNKSVSVHQFSMIPRAEIPRSKFTMQKNVKTTFDAGYLIPVFVEEILPGDSFSVSMTAFARLSTPLVPIMDNLHIDSFFFFVPNRLVWTNWQKFQGEQANPGDSTSYTVPQVEYTDAAVGSIFDQMGLPVVGQIGTGVKMSVNALPFRGYMRIWNEWFRDENLQNSATMFTGDGPDPQSGYALLRRGKRHDYFTSCLPWPQKGESVVIPLGSTAPVVSASGIGESGIPLFKNTTDTGITLEGRAGTPDPTFGKTLSVNQAVQWDTSGLVADLTNATAATINQLRQSFQIQKVLERDARGGTRYTEIIRAHFGVTSPDARLQRPEYLGGGSSPVVINPVAQTSGTAPAGTGYTDTPQGHLAAIGTSVMRGHGFSQSFTEHGYVLGLISVRADLTYQQGVRRMWDRKTRFDFYLPAFAALGEQAVLQREIFATGVAEDDGTVFGYQERWAEYRYNPSEVRGLFRSTAAQPLDVWHLAQNFAAAPVLNASFIQDVPPLERVLAVGSEAAGQHFLGDFFFNIRAARPMPMYSVPGMIDHF